MLLGDLELKINSHVTRDTPLGLAVHKKLS